MELVLTIHNELSDVTHLYSWYKTGFKSAKVENRVSLLPSFCSKCKQSVFTAAPVLWRILYVAYMLTYIKKSCHVNSSSFFSVQNYNSYNNDFYQRKLILKHAKTLQFPLVASFFFLNTSRIN